MRLENKVAVITGGAQGIGRAIALGMAREGARVVVADLQYEKARSVADEVKMLGSDALAIGINVAEEGSVQHLAEATFADFGRIDILVNDAGVYLKSLVVDMSEADWDRTLDINLGGNFLCCRAFVPAMRAQKSGRIISMASGIGHYGMKQF
jgi:3-oxoacyl-[acyl-carrier protein] reductase